MPFSLHPKKSHTPASRICSVIRGHILTAAPNEPDPSAQGHLPSLGRMDGPALLSSLGAALAHAARRPW